MRRPALAVDTTAQDAARLGLTRQEDPFSIKVVRKGDRLFWIRLKLPVVDELVATDFKTQGLSPTDAASALIFALSETSLRGLERIRFQDVAPGVDLDKPRRARLSASLETATGAPTPAEPVSIDPLSEAVAILCRRRGLRPVGEQLVRRRGKLDATFYVASLRQSRTVRLRAI